MSSVLLVKVGFDSSFTVLTSLYMGKALEKSCFSLIGFKQVCKMYYKTC